MTTIYTAQQGDGPAHEVDYDPATQRVRETHVDGELVGLTVVPIPQEEIEATRAAARLAMVEAVQQRLDAEAQTRNYDGILSLCSYATSKDPVFAAEGQAGVEWRDAVWRACYRIEEEAAEGTRLIPSPAELLAALPAMVWPQN